MIGAPQPLLGVIYMRKSIEKLSGMAVETMTDDELDLLLKVAANAAQEKMSRMDHTPLTEPEKVRRVLMARVARESREMFGVIYVDSQHRIITNKVESLGTIDAASVYPRVIVESALLLHAAAVIFWHNHPSGLAEPSRADRAITERLKTALSYVDIKVLDHFVVSGTESVSFAERGWL